MKNYILTMKKTILITIILISTSIHAQKSSGFELGTGLGFSFSTLSELSLTNTSGSIRSLNLDISSEYYFSDKIGLRTKFIFGNKGARRLSGPPNTFIYNLELSYLTIPVLINLHFGSTKKWYFGIGPYLAFLLEAEDSSLTVPPPSDNVKKTDFGVASNIGYKFSVSDSMHLYLEYEGQAGLADVFDANINTNESFKNIRISINFGILFFL